MKKSILKSLVLLSIALLTSCAAVYKPISPKTVEYGSHDFKEGIGFSYKYDVLGESGNRKYAKKEIARKVKVVAVKVTNNTDSVISIGRDVEFYANGKNVKPLQPQVTQHYLKQNAPGYLFYLFLGLLNVSHTETKNGVVTEQSFYPVGLVLGPAVALGNMGVAKKSNNKLFKELYEFDVLNKEIKKGETVYGLIGLKALEYSEISLKFKE